MRPRLLRPPVRLTGASRPFSGSFFVSSEKSAICMKRCPGVRGLNCMTAIVLESFEELDLVAFFKRYVSLFPIHLAALAHAFFPFLAHEVRGANLDHGDLEQMLYRLANLVLARARTHPEQHLAGLFARHGAFLGDNRRENQTFGTTHFPSPQTAKGTMAS